MGDVISHPREAVCNLRIIRQRGKGSEKCGIYLHVKHIWPVTVSLKNSFPKQMIRIITFLHHFESYTQIRFYLGGKTSRSCLVKTNAIILTAR